MNSVIHAGNLNWWADCVLYETTMAIGIGPMRPLRRHLGSKLCKPCCLLENNQLATCKNYASLWYFVACIVPDIPTERSTCSMHASSWIFTNLLRPEMYDRNLNTYLSRTFFWPETVLCPILVQIQILTTYVLKRKLIVSQLPTSTGTGIGVWKNKTKKNLETGACEFALFSFLFAGW